ncbi:uncharacterized protein PHALS_10117 [Plasmopara halstedii]|uniref:Uncharacterized protein n=1 Tax=Plasmopara halstedii TaxID=4781 RepID=A0A0P1AGV7_PLAHL|nr:uncharacterized protein PHALS_10117 [Plasmopara halstedii]CEG39889.1 hypothetical protein PHALS_10117 [Plasmopara halstedii]|eukprot:XP_024576258.1 hypothetical protein PHALS_10117 [Plasmopara halstedii]
MKTNTEYKLDTVKILEKDDIVGKIGILVFKMTPKSTFGQTGAVTSLSTEMSRKINKILLPGM